MRTRIVLLLLVAGAPALFAQQVRTTSTQTEEVVESNDADAVTTSTTTTSVTVLELPDAPRAAPPGWIHLVRLSAIAGPVAFLLLAWVIGAIVHTRLVCREQDRFLLERGSRTPQTIPMLLSASLFFVPFVLFLLFEIGSRREIRRGIGGIVDEWQPVTERAWITLLVCLVLALLPWMFARRADTVA